jgi:adenylate cyclase class 2
VIEAEIKARLVNPDAVRQRLDQWAAGVAEAYTDTYFDTPDQALAVQQRELRVRTVAGPGNVRHVLTFKDRPVDASTQSKPEVEIAVSDAEAAAAILTGLGYPAELAFTKQCVNYRVTRGGRQFLATVVTVPEIAGTYLEVETQAPEDDLGAALDAVRALLTELDVGEDEWTTDTYTNAVRSARAA